MFFLANLALGELVALAAAVSGLLVALYLLDRRRRRQTVATLRFWRQAETAPRRRHRWIREWRSLLLQLAAVALLLLAVAQLRWGSPAPAQRDHVLILDTSAWMGARSPQGTLIERARSLAHAWLRALPSGDRVMVVRADALATPATAFESDRRLLERAITESQPGATALNLQQALEFARQAQRLQGGRAGEIVFAGAGRIPAEETPSTWRALENLRVLPVSDALANCGIRRMGLRRSGSDPDAWEVLIGVRNYGETTRTVPLVIGFGGAIVGTRRLSVPPGAEQEASFRFRTRVAGVLEARLLIEDAFPPDDRGVLELPGQAAVSILVYSSEPDLLRPMLAASPLVNAQFRPPSEYRPGAAGADILVFDRFSVSGPPASDAVWIEPPVEGSPVRVRSTATNATLVRWRADHALGAGLRAKDIRLAATRIFEPAPGDVTVAEAEAGPVIVAREGKPKVVVLGFHPGRSALRYELATPLLVANILRWMRPELFRRWELNAGSAGAVTVSLGAEAGSAAVRVLTDDGSPLPFTVEGDSLRFFAGAPGTVRVVTGDREQVFSLTLPEVAEAKWTPPRKARRGIPEAVAIPASYAELWPWLAAAGAAILLLEWALFGRRRTPRGWWLLKAAVLVAVLVALFQPRLSVFEPRTAVAVLADTSASVTSQDLARASELVGGFERARGRNAMLVIPFARTTRPVEAAERARSWQLRHTGGEPGRATDIEAAVRAAIAALPGGRVPRLVLISDGKENLGSAARAAWQAERLGVPIDTFPLRGHPKPDLRLEAATLPAQAFTGERFPIDLAVSAPRRTSAAVEVAAGDRVLGASTVTLEPGTNQVRVHARLTTSGAIDLAGVVRAPGLGEARFAQSMTLRRPRVLYVSQDPPGAEEHLFKTLEAAEFELRRSTAGATGNLDDYQVVVLNNWNLEAVPPAEKIRLEAFVRQGGGLLVVGGERNVYTQKRPAEDPLERALPATLAPPRAPEGACVVLVLDKSSSMEGRKIELARQSAVGVIENLRPIDLIGVLIFDNSFQWAVPIRRAEERTLIRRVISGIIADGGTQIAPALQEAYRRIRPVNALYKHIVLLTDGISEEGDSLVLAREAAANQVTISTVGLGQDVNRAYLEKVAASARGRAYFLSDPSGLEQILLRDVREHTGTTVIEKSFQPRVAKAAEILEGVGIEQAPPLEGYVRFTPKPGADVILLAEQKDPLLARWQYGLGRAAVFTSDAKSRWAARWVTWPGYDKFWVNLFRDLLPHAQAGEAAVDYNRASGELTIDYRLGRHIEEPARLPDIFVFGPQAFQRPVKVEKLAQGVFRGRVRIDQRQGLFRVRPLEESRAFPEVGFYRQEAELSDYGANEFLLQRISEFTGGRFNPAPGEVFSAGGRAVASTLRLWPGLLALALALNLAELFRRKWPWGAGFQPASRHLAG
jgi:Mg-chelatase subunit ChlD